MKIELPQVGESVTEGIIGKWLKSVGDKVEKYDPLVEVVTDKVNMEMPAPIAGVLSSILVEEGETVPMGSIIAEIDVGDDSPSDQAGLEVEIEDLERIDTTGVLLKNTSPVGPTGSDGPTIRNIDCPEPPVTPHAVRQGKRYSPAVGRLAEKHEIDLSKIIGTGMEGRVTRKDVQNFIDRKSETIVPSITSTSPSVDEERVMLTPIRRMIADNMVISSNSIPQAWSSVEVDVTGLVLKREKAKEDFKNTTGVKLTYFPFIVKAVAESLRENILLNSSWSGDAILIKRRVNIGVAVATPTGLMVPVIHDADTHTVAELSKILDRLANRAREGELELKDVKGGTFTLNNTGALGSVISRPLVNPPQAAILATDLVVKRAVVIDDAIGIRSIMNLSITFDHRILDGADVSKFMNALSERLENVGPETELH